ncbi:MAG: sigma-70 family RNA polymerase sigma factor [Myxococcales bacterium]|nr:sigma-70 family RNA polymerase sigma factor [Myxococcales bacterium]
MTSPDDDLLALTMQHASANPADATALRDALWRRLHAEGWRPAFHTKRADGTVLPNDDRSLLQAFVQGDPDAFQALVHRHGGHLLGFAQRSVPKAQAEEFVQDAFVVLLRKATEVLAKPDQNVRAFLFGVVRNDVRNANRRELLTKRVLDTYAHEPTPDEPFEQVLQQKRTELLPALVAACSPLEQDVVLMALDGKTNPQIAQALGIEPGHVAVLKHRARTKLTRAIAPKASHDPPR